MSARHLRPDLARDGIFNVRDLGGMSAGASATTRRRRLLRGDALHRANRSVPGLVDYGVVRVLDLRDATERERSGEFNAEGVDVVHLPVLDPTFAWEVTVEDPDTTVLGNRYRVILEEFSDRLAGAVNAIAETLAEDDSAVVAYHCAVGKDRTGLLSALVLGAVGVDDHSIVTDYALSSSSTAVQATWLRYMGFADVAEEELETGVWSAQPQTMADTLDWLDRRYGGAGEYLRSAGVDASTLDALRDLMVEGSSDTAAE